VEAEREAVARAVKEAEEREAAAMEVAEAQEAAAMDGWRRRPSGVGLGGGGESASAWQ
jgi:hypothetical protein